MRRVVILAAVAGAIGFSVLLSRVGLGAVLSALQTLSWWGFATIITFHLAVIAATGFAWSLQARGRSEGRVICYIWGRLIRDSAGETLPFSQVGGLVLGARGASLCGVSGVFAAASTIVDATIELAARVPYMFLAAALLAWHGFGDQITMILAMTLLLAAAVAVCVLLQRRGADLIEALGARLVPQWLSNRSGASGGVMQTIRAIHARRTILIRAFVVHFFGWILSGLEVVLPLWLMGRPVWIGTGIAIDCLVSIMRSVSFIVPGAIGVQEGAYVFVCGMFGIDPQVALALSLLRRGRDIAIALPSLLMWQILEGQTALRGIKPRRATSLLLPSAITSRNSDAGD